MVSCYTIDLIAAHLYSSPVSPSVQSYDDFMHGTEPGDDDLDDDEIETTCGDQSVEDGESDKI